MACSCAVQCCFRVWCLLSSSWCVCVCVCVCVCEQIWGLVCVCVCKVRRWRLHRETRTHTCTHVHTWMRRNSIFSLLFSVATCTAFLLLLLLLLLLMLMLLLLELLLMLARRTEAEAEAEASELGLVLGLWLAEAMAPCLTAPIPLRAAAADWCADACADEACCRLCSTFAMSASRRGALACGSTGMLLLFIIVLPAPLANLLLTDVSIPKGAGLTMTRCFWFMVLCVVLSY